MGHLFECVSKTPICTILLLWGQSLVLISSQRRRAPVVVISIRPWAPFVFR